MRDVVDEILKAFNTGDVSTIDEVFAPGYVDHQRPDWMKDEGPAEFRAIVDLARRGQPGLVVSVDGPVVRDGEMIALRMRWLSDLRERETIEMLRLGPDGRVVEHWGAVAATRPVG